MSIGKAGICMVCCSVKSIGDSHSAFLPKSPLAQSEIELELTLDGLELEGEGDREERPEFFSAMRCSSGRGMIFLAGEGPREGARKSLDPLFSFTSS